MNFEDIPVGSFFREVKKDEIFNYAFKVNKNQALIDDEVFDYHKGKGLLGFQWLCLEQLEIYEPELTDIELVDMIPDDYSFFVTVTNGKFTFCRRFAKIGYLWYCFETKSFWDYPDFIDFERVWHDYEITVCLSNVDMYYQDCNDIGKQSES